MNLVNNDEEPRSIFISVDLSTELQQVVLVLLREFKDVLAWTYIEMPGLNSWLITHKLKIKEES